MTDDILKVMNNIRNRNRNKDITTLPSSNHIIKEELYDLQSLKDKLKDCLYVNSINFYIPDNHYIYYISKQDPLFILYKGGVSMSYNIIKQELVTSCVTLNINNFYIFISKKEKKNNCIL